MAWDTTTSINLFVGLSGAIAAWTAITLARRQFTLSAENAARENERFIRDRIDREYAVQTQRITAEVEELKRKSTYLEVDLQQTREVAESFRKHADYCEEQLKQCKNDLALQAMEINRLQQFSTGKP